MRGTVASVDAFDAGAGMEEYDIPAQKMTYSMNYLDISVLYPYPVGPGAAFAGLDIGINLSAKLNSDLAGSKEIDMNETADATAYCHDENDKGMSCTNGIDYGLLLGYTYPINEDIGVSVGYYLGLADFSAGIGTATSATADSATDKHNGILINVGYSLPF